AVALGHPALPFSENRVALLPIVLLGRHELFCMVRLGLAGAEGFGNGEHTASLLLERKRGLRRLIAIGLGGIFRDIMGRRDQDKLLFGGLVKLQLLAFCILHFRLLTSRYRRTRWLSLKVNFRRLAFRLPRRECLRIERELILIVPARNKTGSS